MDQFLREMADAEDRCDSVSVGGLAHDLNVLNNDGVLDLGIKIRKLCLGENQSDSDQVDAITIAKLIQTYINKVVSRPNEKLEGELRACRLFIELLNGKQVETTGSHWHEVRNSILKIQHKI